ncbi:MAG: hypothetical protein PVF47_03415 [Anaerolineae bacterium]|jgi:hypothetical protein
MEAFAGIFSFLSGVPAIAGLILTGVTIFLTSDWRLSLTALLVQYVLLGMALTRFVQAELALVRVLVGVLVVPILYLTARRIQEVRAPALGGRQAEQVLRLPVGWSAGPLGLPLRLLTVLLVGLALIRFFPNYRTVLPTLVGEGVAVPPDIIFVAFWLATMGMVGLIVSSDALRVGPALLTILAGFDLVYAGLHQNLAVTGFFSALTLLAALAFSYLAAVQSLGPDLEEGDEEEAEA